MKTTVNEQNAITLRRFINVTITLRTHPDKYQNSDDMTKSTATEKTKKVNNIRDLINEIYSTV